MSEEVSKRAASLPPIPPKDAKIWRYRNFAQLISILEYGALWFSRADLFQDPLEASHSKKTVDTRAQRLRESGTSDEYVEQQAQNISDMFRFHKQASYLNCWHLNNRESTAMWNQYSTEGQGIAIQSSVGDLKQALETRKEYYFNGEEAPNSKETPQMFTIGEVQYVDYNVESTPDGNLYHPLFYKRKSYKHEQEFRVVTSNREKSMRLEWLANRELYMREDHLPPGKYIAPNLRKISEKLNGESSPSDWVEFVKLVVEQLEIQDEELPTGKYIDLDLDKLIEKIHVSPTAADWFLKLTKKVVERYEMNPHIVIRSPLDEEAVY